MMITDAGVSGAAANDDRFGSGSFSRTEAYAHCADRRDAQGQMSLFTADTHFVVYINAKDPTPSQELHSREALAPVIAALNQYDATTHFVGQSTILSLSNGRATGEAYCLAHHVTVDGGKRRVMIASLRYLDTFKETDGAWLFSECYTRTGWTSARCHDRDREPEAAGHRRCDRHGRWLRARSPRR
jgi:hypothetical protein